MQSHNLQYAPARYALHFFQIFKEQTPANDITSMSIEKSAITTRPAGIIMTYFSCLYTAMVELVGIEPTTYGLQSRRSPS